MSIFSGAPGQEIAAGESRSPLDPARRKQIEGWIAQLDADSYDEREAASRHLQNAGEDAAPHLEAVLRHPSPEVRFRAQAVLRGLRQAPLRRLREEMEAFCAGPDERLDVERAMCLISRLMERRVMDKDLLLTLDKIATKVTERLAKDGDPSQTDPQKAVAAIQQVIYKDFGFRGNEQDYGNPDNCSLAIVLRERKGKPILLGQLVVSVAQRAKIPIVGINVSGRYLVKYDGAQSPPGFPRDDIFIDPFREGRILTRDDRLRDYPHHDPDRMAPPGTNRETIARILRNVVSDYGDRGAAADPDGQELVERMLELIESPIAAP